MLLAVVEQTFARISFMHDYTGRPIALPNNDNFAPGRGTNAAAVTPVAAAATFFESGAGNPTNPLPGAGHLRGADGSCAPPFPITEAGVQSPFAGNSGGSDVYPNPPGVAATTFSPCNPSKHARHERADRHRFAVSVFTSTHSN